MNLGAKIKENRKQRGLTQSEFAEKCGMTQTYLSQLENNAREPNISTLKKVSSVLNIPLPFLFLMSMEDDDIPEEKRETLKLVNPMINSLFNDARKI